MGNYNNQYRDYYRSALNKNYQSYTSNNKNSDKTNFFVKRIIVDLVGVTVLFAVVLFCKEIVTPKTQMVYSFSKKVVNQNFDYKKAWNEIQSINFGNIKNKSENYIEDVIDKIKGKESMDTSIRKNYEVPCVGKITSTFGDRVDPFTGKKQTHKGIDIAVKQNTPIKACANGKVKQCGEEKGYGKCILIDHGSGIETKYAHLNSIEVKKDQVVKKGQEIAKSGNTGRSTGPHLHFEIIYMGENKDPEKFFKKWSNENGVLGTNGKI